jgi:hypothetical protein
MAPFSTRGGGLVQTGLGLRRATVPLLVGEDRVRVELFANLVDELEARKLQEADRLLQLGGHHQLLTESELLLDLHRLPSRKVRFHPGSSETNTPVRGVQRQSCQTARRFQ